jgi:integrase
LQALVMVRVRTRGGQLYKPSARKGCEAALSQRILPALGGRKLEDITIVDVQGLVDRLMREGLDPSTIKNALMPLRVIYRRAVARGRVAVNPTTGLELPTIEGKRDRIASPAEAAMLLEALPPPDRALWACAFYAGLRSGELQGLDWSCVDLAGGTVRIERAYDPKSKVMIEPKSKAGGRRVPIPAILRDHLIEHRMNTEGTGLVFVRSGMRPFDNSVLRKRAHRFWVAAGLDPIGLHECRHTYASLMIAAGVNAKALSTYLEHANIATTFDRYGHLMPGNEDEAAELLQGYLDRANTRARLAEIDG